jgi:drug/metabolite transporter (DMT)-like permease
MLSTYQVGLLLATLALVVFSVNIIITKVASAKLSLNLGFSVSLSINALFSLLVFAVDLAMRERPLQWDWYGFGWFLLGGVFATYLGRWFFFDSIAILGPAKASTFQVSSPLFTALLAWLFLGQQLSAIALAAMGLTVYGLYLTSSNRPLAAPRGPAATTTAWRAAGSLKALLRSGAWLGMASSMAYAVGNVLRGAAIHRWHEPVLGALLGAASGIVLHCLISGGATKSLAAELKTADRKGLWLYALIGMLTVTGQMLNIASMAFIPVAISALITLSSPLLVFPMSYLLLKNEESITLRTMAGSVLTLVGIGAIILH